MDHKSDSDISIVVNELGTILKGLRTRLAE